MQEKFENVTLVSKANIYLEGKVTSRTFFTPAGDRKTAGIFLPGEYEFSTSDAEIMDVVQGNPEIMIAGETKWKKYGPGESFNIPGNSSFKLKIGDIFDYICSYIKE